MKKDIDQHIAQCLVYQHVKAEHQRRTRPLQSFSILVWKQEYTTMDFMMGLPRTPKGNSVVWLIIDRLTKSAYFLPFKVGMSLEKLAKLYIEYIVRLH